MQPDLNDLVESIIERVVQDKKVQEAIEAMPVELYDQLEDDLGSLIENWLRGSVSSKQITKEATNGESIREASGDH